MTVEDSPRTRPVSAVPSTSGLVGAAALALVILVVSGSDVSLGARILLVLLAPALSMIGWEVLVRRTYRSPAAGLRSGAQRDWRIHGYRSLVKILGLWATWVAIAACYTVAGRIGGGILDAYLNVLLALLPLLVVGSVLYFFALEPHLEESFDGHWHAGLIILGRWGDVDVRVLVDHIRGWIIRALFLAFMGTVLPPLVGQATSVPLTDFSGGIVVLVLRITVLLFLFDVAFGTIGYALTFRVLDSHIRSTNPYLLGWAAALACYPPIILMGRGGVLDYKGSLEWMDIVPSGAASYLWGGALVGLVAIYVWCTVAFGIRFSNLTHRGIITAGPYALTKHPAYIAKNLYWWLLYLPFAAAATPEEGLRNTLLLLTVNAIYLIRAKTEEQHLRSDPTYREYASWIEQRNRALATRVLGFLRRRLGLIPLPTSRGPRPQGRLVVPARVLAGLTGAVVMVSILASSHAHAPPSHPGRPLSGFLKEEGILGGVVAIRTSAGETFVHAAGWSSLHPRERMLPDQRFRVASLSKPVTAAAVLALAERGQVDLDAPVADILPELRHAGDARYRDLTIRHLLAHEGGWRVSDQDPAVNPRWASCHDVAVWALAQKLDFSPGQEQEYSNVGYCFLELVIERASGTRYEDFVREEILEPHRIDEMSIDPAGTRHFVRRDGRWRIADTRLLSSRPALGGWSTDVRTYLEFVARVGPETDANAHRVGESHYSLGWRIWPERGGLATHYGYFEGVFSVAMAHPDGWAAVALFNSAPRHPDQAFRRLSHELARR
jgi:CubicO group peptidase (beta-lactamase class C family)/protein-S-isoprenylcysteine O-methyltransferase Ste14